MTDKERLEIIKMDNERHHQEVVFSSQVLSDIKWLIQQAERVEELEEREKIYKEIIQSYGKIADGFVDDIESLVKRNEHYKQFIEHFAYSDEDYEGMLRLQNKAKKLI